MIYDTNSPLFRTFLASTGASHMQGGKRDNKPQARDKQNPPKPLTE